MKRTLLVFLVLSCLCLKVQAQSNEDVQSLRTLVSNHYQGAVISQKQIFISTWKSSDMLSRERNIEAQRVYQIYKEAKLKNGEQGVVFLSVNLDDDTQSGSLAASRDSLSQELVTSSQALKDILAQHFGMGQSNELLLIDTSGHLTKITGSKDLIFPTFRNLIIR